jgi:Phage portal protein
MSDKKDQEEPKKNLKTMFLEASSDSSVGIGDQLVEILEKSGIRTDGPLAPLMKGVPILEDDKKKDKGIKLAFYNDPIENTDYSGIFKTKRKLLPDAVIKLIRVQNHLVASILRARGNTLAMHGNKRKDRFDIGFEVNVKPEFEQHVKPEQMAKIRERIERVERILLNCGSNEGLDHDERMSFSEYLDLQARNGLAFGRFGTEIIYEGEGEERTFHSFRPVDIGTIYNTVRKNGSGNAEANAVRRGSIKKLQALTGIKIDISALEQDEYAYIQSVDGIPVQAFSAKELLVFNLFPSTDIEHAGYPVTPIDTCLSSVTTHLAIDAYNRLYFQNGRAAKGMLVVKSAEIDQATIQKIRQDFMASINSVNNAFRAPVFGVNPEDDVTWIPMVSNAGDGEFQFLYDQVARNILSTFNMSPDELPGYGHLSRGTNQQTLSESSNEFALTAARDTGLRPLILRFQAFLNEKLFPIVDAELAQICYFQLAGLDAQSRDQESLRLQQDMPIHMTYDDVLGDVDKNPIGERLGGQFPFNERYQVIADKMLRVGEMREGFLDDPTALLDPMLQFMRDPFWVQSVNLLMQTNPDTIKAYYASRPYSYELLKMLVSDHLEEGEE